MTKVMLCKPYRNIPMGAIGQVLRSIEDNGVDTRTISPYGFGEYDVEWEIEHLQVLFNKHGVCWVDGHDVEVVR